MKNRTKGHLPEIVEANERIKIINSAITVDTILYKSIFLLVVFLYMMVKKHEKYKRRKYRDSAGSYKSNNYA